MAVLAAMVGTGENGEVGGNGGRDAPLFHPAHLGVEVGFELTPERDAADKVRSSQSSYQCYDNLPIREGFRELDYAAERLSPKPFQTPAPIVSTVRRQSQAHTFFVQLPEGWQRHFGEDGRPLRQYETEPVPGGDEKLDPDQGQRLFSLAIMESPQFNLAAAGFHAPGCPEKSRLAQASLRALVPSLRSKKPARRKNIPACWCRMTRTTLGGGRQGHFVSNIFPRFFIGFFIETRQAGRPLLRHIRIGD
jgi:hypothetical protein